MMNRRESIFYRTSEQRGSQSFKTRGAVQSFELVNQFLQANAEAVKIGDLHLQFGAMTTDSVKMQRAKQLRQQLNDDFGKPTSHTKATWVFSLQPHFEDYQAWSRPAEQLPALLCYVDELGPTQGLGSPPAAVYICVTVDFWLKEQARPFTKDNQSLLQLFLCPTSNAGWFAIDFPFTDKSSKFEAYRQNLQSTCPAPLEDKYFYLRKGDNYTYRKLYS